MSDDSEARWSPADNPYAIAVSQSQWALWAAQLLARDVKENCGDLQSQIYARQIFGQLPALQRCAEMMARELKRLGVDKAHRDHLRQAIREFEAAVPGAPGAAEPGDPPVASGSLMLSLEMTAFMLSFSRCRVSVTDRESGAPLDWADLIARASG